MNAAHEALDAAASRAKADPKLVLIGFMGAGKTTAAEALGGGAVDVDAVIEAREGRRVAEIFAKDGEGAFRELEERVTLELLADPEPSAVALGGGAVLSPRVRSALAGARVVWLDVEVEDAWARVRGGEGARPLARDPERFREVYEERREVYEALADAVVPASRSRAVGAVADAMRGLEPGAARVIWAATASGDYPVYVGDGLLTERGFWPANVAGRRVVISDENVASRYGAMIEPALERIGFAAGERSKTLRQAEAIWAAMAQAGVNRADVAVALGGGVVGDLGGFCAAAYQRGIRVVQIPTTLVAQVDSAYGGKTGVDLEQAKNYVGAFHQPVAVITDPSTLATLPPEELAAGYAEVVKTGLIAGGALWRLIAGGAPPRDPDVIAGCARTKLGIVAADELDTGVRQLLNLGHTIGHAIETATGYARYRHGEAVGLGLLAELRLSGAPELREEVRELFARAGLPVTLDRGVDLERVLLATRRDKKRVGEAPVPFVLCPAPGRATFGQVVAEGDVRAAVAELWDER